MKIKIDPKRNKPIFDQIIDEIKYAVGAGILKPGSSLPSMRTLASELGVNRNTVLKAYDILEREGFVTTRRGTGSYISSDPPVLKAEERKKIIIQEIDRLLTEAYYLQIPVFQLKETLNERIQAFVLNMGRSGQSK